VPRQIIVHDNKYLVTYGDPTSTGGYSYEVQAIAGNSSDANVVKWALDAWDAAH
jgi:hypothetical protein